MFDFNYSVDMIRLNNRVTMRDYQKLYYWLSYNALKFNFELTSWESRKQKDYKYNLSIRFKTGKKSFFIAFFHNSQKPSQSEYTKYTIALEFNPNKLGLNNSVVNTILREYFSEYDYTQNRPFSFVTVRSMDLAVDVKDLNIRNIFFDKNGKQEIKAFYFGGDNRTYYIGKGSGRVKVYNKALELEQNQELHLGYDLTRFEFSVQFGVDFNVVMSQEFKLDISNFVLNMPKFYYINSAACSKKVHDLDFRAFLFALTCSPELFSEYSRYKRSKYENLFSFCDCIHEIKISTEEFTSTILKFVSDLKIAVDTEMMSKREELECISVFNCLELQNMI